MKPSLIIVGLGNPGNAYVATRHNAGFQAIDVLAKYFGEGEWQEKQKFVSSVCEARIVTVPILLVKPQTFMNRSGEAIRKLVDFYKVDPAHQILILSDDIDLPLGEVRLRMSGGPGTHNGLKSICATLGENFPRLRIGLGSAPEGEDLANWVLSVPRREEVATLQATYESIPEKVKSFVLNAAD